MIPDNSKLCTLDSECADNEYCNPCGTTPCFDCDGCLSACTTHSCTTENEAQYDSVRPECGVNNFAIVEDGCWKCVDSLTCEEEHNAQCDDGSEPSCEMVIPQCESYEILAYQNNCYSCVNPDTCLPWGVPECYNDEACDADSYCDYCGSASCPDCDNCVAICSPHGCETETEVTCNALRPHCQTGNISVIENGCWVCKANDCTELDRDEHCDDGTTPICTGPTPICADGDILAYQNNCEFCVNPLTCLPPGADGCKNDSSCSIFGYCDECATSTSNSSDDCVAACVPHKCPTKIETSCNMDRPECEGDAVAVSDGNCYICLSLDDCFPIN